MQSKLTLVDLFCGAGGLSQGFKECGFQTLLGVDYDPAAVKTFEKNHGKCLRGRIEDISSNEIKKEINYKEITVLAGGPPCQAFSTIACAKLRSMGRSTNTRNPLNKLYKEFFRLVKDLKPKFFVMENVPRMFSMQEGIIKKEIELELDGMYNVNFYNEQVADFGVPQFRKRVLAIGNNLGLPNPILKHTHYDPLVGNPKDGRIPNETVRSAISDLPKIKCNEGLDFVKYSDKKKLSNYQKNMRKDSCGFYDHIARVHNERDLEIFSLLKPGQWIRDLPKHYNPYRKDIFKDRFKKLPWDRPSYTIIAHISKDGLMHIHPDKKQNRSITPREAARLQSFSDGYLFEGTHTQQFVQIGNAVPPIFARAIADGIIKSLLVKCQIPIKPQKMLK